MATLNKAKKQTQTILKWGGIFLVLIFLFLVGIRFLTFVKDAITPPPLPQTAFGKLPPISFPDHQKENITYSLNTLSGFLPNFSDRARVYKIVAPQPTLLGLEKTREKVAQVDFISNGVQISEDTYQWVDQEKSLQRKITINIFSGDFNLSSPYLVTPSLQTFSRTDEKEEIIEEAKSFLSSMSLLPSDIDEKKTKTTLFSIEGSALAPTSKISNTKIVKVDFFQKDVDSMPIYYENGITSTINLLLGKEKNILQVVDATYFHKDISQASSTYAIKSASQAFEELKKGKGYIAYKPEGIVEFTIKEVFLGYYTGKKEQEFLMPIVVFKGDNDFVGYVSAVRDEWISN